MKLHLVSHSLATAPKIKKNLGDFKLWLFEDGTPEFPERPKFLLKLRKKAVEGRLFFSLLAKTTTLLHGKH